VHGWLAPLPGVVVFPVVQPGLFGVYMGSPFAPNHKGMRHLHATGQTDGPGTGC
jgi:hypothetical protein